MTLKYLGHIIFEIKVIIRHVIFFLQNIRVLLGQCFWQLLQLCSVTSTTTTPGRKKPFAPPTLHHNYKLLTFNNSVR